MKQALDFMKYYEGGSAESRLAIPPRLIGCEF